MRTHTSIVVALTFIALSAPASRSAISSDRDDSVRVSIHARTAAAEREAAQSAASPVRAGVTAPAHLPLLKQRCNQPDGDAKPFWFRTTDGALLDGAVLGHGQVGVVLAPELGGDVCNWLPYALFLGQHGYQVLLFDPRGQGLSPFPTSQSDGRVNADVVAGEQELRRRGATQIVLAGASLGGSAVLIAAASIKPSVAGVVSLSGADTTTLRNNATVYAQPLNPDDAVTHLKMPVLYIADLHDGQGPFDTDARKLYAHTRSPISFSSCFPASATEPPCSRLKVSSSRT
jgi:pimeloyl-ACP methyl ester carboxylesterase